MRRVCVRRRSTKWRFRSTNVKLQVLVFNRIHNVLRHQLMLPQGGISSSGHMLQRLLQQQRQQTQQQFLLQQQQAQMPQIKCPQCGTSSSIPLIPPSLNFIVTCTNAACRMKLKLNIKAALFWVLAYCFSVEGSRIRRNFKEATALGAKFVAQVSGSEYCHHSTE